MDDKLKVFWNLDVLVKMCRSKNDGPSLRIEESDIVEKINNYTQEIDEIKALSEEDTYDSSAEMADRNIEIITKRQLQKLKNELKDKNKLLNELKSQESNLYDQTSLLRDNKSSQEKYILSMQDRINESTDTEIIDRYNALIAETSEKVAALKDELYEQNTSYNKIQKDIIDLTEEIAALEEQIIKKKKLLTETQANLENKENYIDKVKKEKDAKKINDLEAKIQTLSNRLEIIRKDPKYLETKIKDIINGKKDLNDAKPYLVDLINQVINIPYINVPADNALEEELLRATHARDSFAQEIDQKSYNILEANTPEKVRIDFLIKRITNWQCELEELKQKITLVDKDKQFDYETKNNCLRNMIKVMKNDLKEFIKAYEEAPEVNIGVKASLKASLEEKREDLKEAEKIATAFRLDEAEDIANATRILKYECEQLNNNIYNAKVEIANIKNRLTSKKSGLIDITSKNKDKDTLKELAQIVIDIKHRRSFPETPIDIINRLEEELQISLTEKINLDLIKETSSLITIDYNELINREEPEILETSLEEDFIEDNKEPIEKRGVKVIEESVITEPFNITSKEENRASKELEAAIKEATKDENSNEKITEPVPVAVSLEENEPTQETKTSVESNHKKEHKKHEMHFIII